MVEKKYETTGYRWLIMVLLGAGGMMVTYVQYTFIPIVIQVAELYGL